MAMTKHIDLANWEIFLWSLYGICGDIGMDDIELAFLKTHELAPQKVRKMQASYNLVSSLFRFLTK